VKTEIKFVMPAARGFWEASSSWNAPDLGKQQFAALQKATFLGMTIEETVEYDNRHARIGEICREIDKFKATN